MEAASVLQASIKRRQVQPMYNRYVSAARVNYDLNTLKEMSKPYLLKDLRNAWKTAIYSNTIYQKPMNRLTKAEIYHELLNINHDFSRLPKKEANRPVRRRRQ